MREFVGTKTPAPSASSPARRLPVVTDDVGVRAAQATSQDDSFTFGNVSVLPPRGQQAERQAAPGAASDSLEYERDYVTFLVAPDPALDLTKLKDDLSKEYTSVTASGIWSTSPPETELFLLYVLWELRGENRGEEMDVIAPIAWPKKEGDPPPVGRVTIIIDHEGNAEARLIGTGGPPAPKQLSVATAKSKLKTDYGFASVKNERPAEWSKAHISDVAGALSLLPSADKKALKGVHLIRVKELASGGSAEFNPGGNFKDGKILDLPTLKIADLAFDKNPFQFFGGTTKSVPASFAAILHEVGHAVEKEEWRAANEAWLKAAVAEYKPGKDVEKAFDKPAALAKEIQKLREEKPPGYEAKVKKLWPQYEAAAAKYEAAVAKYEPLKAETKAKAAAREVTEADPAKIVPPLEADALKKEEAATGALRDAKAIKLTPAEATSGQAYLDAIEATAAAIDGFENDPISKGEDIAALERLETSVLDQIEKRDAEQKALAKAAPTHPALSALTLVATAQDEWFRAARTLARVPYRTTRVQKFVDLVTREGIEPFTEYAMRTWPHEPHEFYAEAYSLWLTDRQFVLREYPAIFQFFESGEYRK